MKPLFYIVIFYVTVGQLPSIKLQSHHICGSWDRGSNRTSCLGYSFSCIYSCTRGQNSYIYSLEIIIGTPVTATVLATSTCSCCVHTRGEVCRSKAMWKLHCPGEEFNSLQQCDPLSNGLHVHVQAK